jgi:hypothetical protein
VIYLNIHLENFTKHSLPKRAMGYYKEGGNKEKKKEEKKRLD